MEPTSGIIIIRSTEPRKIRKKKSEYDGDDDDETIESAVAAAAEGGSDDTDGKEEGDNNIDQQKEQDENDHQNHDHHYPPRKSHMKRLGAHLRKIVRSKTPGKRRIPGSSNNNEPSAVRRIMIKKKAGGNTSNTTTSEPLQQPPVETTTSKLRKVVFPTKRSKSTGTLAVKAPTTPTKNSSSKLNAQFGPNFKCLAISNHPDNKNNNTAPPSPSQCGSASIAQPAPISQPLPPNAIIATTGEVITVSQVDGTASNMPEYVQTNETIVYSHDHHQTMNTGQYFTNKLERQPKTEWTKPDWVDPFKKNDSKVENGKVNDTLKPASKPIEWEKPSWTNTKTVLKKTELGSKVKKGTDLARPITSATTKKSTS